MPLELVPQILTYTEELEFRFYPLIAHIITMMKTTNMTTAHARDHNGLIPTPRWAADCCKGHGTSEEEDGSPFFLNL